ncbi:MAG: nitroreductase family protein [Pseudomonadota bacterium]
MDSQADMVRLDAPAELSMPIGEAMFTQRAIRRLDPDRPVPVEHIRIIMDAGSKAPNGGNAQPARYLVVRDRARLEEFGKLYFEAWWAKRRDAYGWTGKHDIPEGSVYRLPSILADEMVDVPAVILAFSEPSGVAAASTFPSVQNMLLAARALGVGSVLTTLHPEVMERVHALFNIPDGLTFHCCIPLGYPRGNFGPTSRLPTSVTTYWDAWGDAPPWA